MVDSRVLRCAGALLLLLACVHIAAADMHSHKYKPGEPVYLWVNKIGPFQNPQETYNYYDLPFCPPANTKAAYYEGLGEALQGYELRLADVVLSFQTNVAQTEVCTRPLTHKEVKQFKYAIRNNYWFQCFFDDLPVWGMVGELVSDGDENEKVYIYTHKKFAVTYNGNRVIEVNLTSESPVEVKEGVSLTFSYSAEWYPTDIPFGQRFDKYLDETFFEHQIHWFSIFNSFMMVIFLTGLVAMILMRTLRQDFARYAADDDGDGVDLAEDSGWKQIHWDVFRPPPHLALFSAFLGIGQQLLWLVFSVILLAFLGSFYEERGNMATAFVVCYALTSVVGGYVSGGNYSRNGGKEWIKTMLIASLFFPAVCAVVSLALNFVAVAYASDAAMPLGTMLAVFLIWAFVSFPLTLLGTILGRNWAGQPDFPCRVAQVPRQIPEKKWYLEPWVHVALGGILPFGSIFIEMYFVFTSFWHYKYYYVYGFMLLVHCILIVVTVCVTIVSTYFLLNSEDWRWQWTSFMSSASTALYVFIYSIYYYFVKTKMSGFFQAVFYFGYMGMMCVGLGLMCGAIGYFGTSLFVYRIYSVKLD